MRAYRVKDGALPEDVTNELLPAQPAFTHAERRHYGPYIASSLSEARDEDLALDVSKLQYAPTMRWSVVGFDPVTPIPDDDLRRYGDWAHFGFVVWNGAKFELRQQVTKSLWPCSPVTKGAAPCSRFPDGGPDPFLTDED